MLRLPLTSVLLVAAAFLLFTAFSVYPQRSRPYRSLAVMDLEVSNVSDEQMREVVDYLTMHIRETGNIRRVVEREERERRLERRGATQITGQYIRDQLAGAAVLNLDLAVLGRITWNRQQYGLQLRLLEVSSGRVLYEEGGAFNTKGQMLAACDRMAIRIAAAAVAARQKKTVARKTRKPLEPFLGFSPGQVGVSSGSVVAGGSYFYARTSLMFNRNLGVGARYAFRLFPTIWADHLLNFDLRLQAPLENDIWFIVEGSYLFNFGKQGFGSHHVGLRISPFAGGEDEFLFELLPVALYFDLETGDPVFMLELLALVVFFPL
jgi:hypothetical protein